MKRLTRVEGAAIALIGVAVLGIVAARAVTGRPAAPPRAQPGAPPVATMGLIVTVGEFRLRIVNTDPVDYRACVLTVDRAFTMRPARPLYGRLPLTREAIDARYQRAAADANTAAAANVADAHRRARAAFEQRPITAADVRAAEDRLRQDERDAEIRRLRDLAAAEEQRLADLLRLRDLERGEARETAMLIHLGDFAQGGRRFDWQRRQPVTLDVACDEVRAPEGDWQIQPVQWAGALR